MTVFVTGGTGFIGSHTVVELIQQGIQVIIADNLMNSDRSVLNRIQQITGISPIFYECDVTEKTALEKIFQENHIDAAIHFAGLKSVRESCEKPLWYYGNNLTSAIVLAEVMAEHSCKKLVFSSSATVYGKVETFPIREDAPTGTVNPYAATKLMIERIYSDLAASDPEWNITLLRYFNPIGAHESGLIGESPNGIPNNLVPNVVNAALGKAVLNVTGTDYPTPDGTGIRDYIHVCDLAKGHVAALQQQKPGVHVYNLGTGHGYSVLDIIHTFEKVNNVTVPYITAPRRAGDIAISYADCTLAKKELGWEAKLGLEEMCRSAWNYAKRQGQ